MNTQKELRMEEPKKKQQPDSNDSSISLTFDSGDCGYKSGESACLSSSGGKLQEGFDSGLVPDCGVAEEPPAETSEPPKRKILLEDIFSQDKDGDTILHLAVVEARSDVLFPLLRLVPHPDFLDISNNLFQTVLHVAALTGRASVVRRLVVAGATLDLGDHGGNTPLHVASRRGDLDCVLALLTPVSEEELGELSYPAYPQTDTDLTPLLNAKNYDGQACVHLAAAGGFSKVMECLYSHGADINHQDGKTGRTALHYAAESCNGRLVELLLETCGADPSVPNYAGQLPLSPPSEDTTSDDEVDPEEVFRSLVNARN